MDWRAASITKFLYIRAQLTGIAPLIVIVVTVISIRVTNTLKMSRIQIVSVEMTRLF